MGPPRSTASRAWGIDQPGSLPTSSCGRLVGPPKSMADGAARVPGRKGSQVGRHGDRAWEKRELGGSVSLGDKSGASQVPGKGSLGDQSSLGDKSTPLLAALRLTSPSCPLWRAVNASLRTGAFKARGRGPSTLARAPVFAPHCPLTTAVPVLASQLLDPPPLPFFRPNRHFLPWMTFSYIRKDLTFF